MINPLNRISSKNSLRTTSSSRDMPYRGPKSGSVPDLSRIAWSYLRRRGSNEATVFKNSGRNSWYSQGTIVRISITGALLARDLFRSRRETENICSS